MVSIFLPRENKDHATFEPELMRDELYESLGETILLVEDDAIIWDETTKALERLGYRVLLGEDSASALAISENEERIDLVILDINLPGGMNGIEIFNAIKKQRPGIKCIFISRYSSSPDDQLPEGAEFLSKPVSIEELSDTAR